MYGRSNVRPKDAGATKAKTTQRDDAPRTCTCLPFFLGIFIAFLNMLVIIRNIGSIVRIFVMGFLWTARTSDGRRFGILPVSAVKISLR
jgi:hypothetical protein